MRNKKDFNYDEYPEFDDSYNNDGNNRKNNEIIIIIIAVIVIAAIIFGGIFIRKKFEISSMEKKAQNFAEMDDYDEAMKLYAELYAKTGNIEFKSLKNQMAIKKEVTETLEDAKSHEQSGDLVKAIVIYKMVPREDAENYKKASDQIDSLKRDVVKKASTLIDSGNSSAASTLLSDYISVIPDDKFALELYKKASGKNDQQIKEVVVSKTVPVVVSGGSSDSANSIAKAITGTYQYITSGEANVRSAPSKGSSVVGTVRRGDEVYIYDTYVESESRIWCKTDLGWISYNTMNNTIR